MQTCVKRLSADELNNYTITDVVMPLPGSQVQYPSYGGENWLEQILGEDGIALKQLDHRVKYALSIYFVSLLCSDFNLYVLFI